MKGAVFPTLLIVLLLAILSLQILSLPSENTSTQPQQLRELAAVLEQQELFEAAIDAYESYLDQASMPSDQRANILYRVGQIYEEQLADYENALATFIRVRELFPQARIADDAQKRMVACLEAMNRSSDAKRQMQSFASLDEDAQEDATGPVVAKIDERTITMGQLDREIEKLPPQLQARYQDPAKKLEFLRQYLLEELLYDMGQRRGYNEDKEVRKRLRDIERQIIVQKVYSEEIADTVQLDDSDYELYYQAHKDEFKEPAKVTVAHIQLDEREQAEDVLNRLKEGEDFATVAEEESADTNTKAKGGELGNVSVDSNFVPGLGSVPELVDAVASLEIGEVTGPVQSPKGWHVLSVTGREPEQQRTLDEVKSQIEFALRRMKEEEQGETLIKRMLEAQKVTIYQERFPTPMPTPSQ